MDSVKRAREWFKNMMNDCVVELHRQLMYEGRSVTFRIFRSWTEDNDRRGDSPPTLREMSEHFGVTRDEAEESLLYARRRLRKILKERLRDQLGE